MAEAAEVKKAEAPAEVKKAEAPKGAAKEHFDPHTASTNLIGNIATVIAAGPALATVANASNPNGSIMDYVGNLSLIELKLKEAAVLGTGLLAVTDSSDTTNLGYLNGALAALTGEGSSSMVISAVTGVYASGPNTATAAMASNANGPIMDYKGNVLLMSLKLQEAAVLLKAVQGITASGDPNLTTLTSVASALI